MRRFSYLVGILVLCSLISVVKVGSDGDEFNYYYAKDDTLIQPYYKEKGVTPRGYTYFLSQDTDFLPLNEFYIYVSGYGVISNSNRTVYCVAYIEEKVTVTSSDGKNETLKTWSNKVWEHTFILERRINDPPYMTLKVGSNVNFGEVRKERELIVVNYFNVNITFYHQTERWVLPYQEQTIGEHQLEVLFYIVLTAVALFLFGGYIGQWFQKRAGVVPQFSIWMFATFFFAIVVGLLGIMIFQQQQQYIFYEIMLIEPLLIVIPLGFFSTVFYSSRYGRNLKKTCVWVLPKIPLPKGKSSLDAWDESNFKEYFKTNLDFNIHTLLSYRTDEGHEWYVAKKRRNSWLDALRRVVSGKGITFKVDDIKSTLECSAGKYDKNKPPTQQVYDRLIPVWDFKFYQGTVKFGQKNKLGFKPLFANLAMVGVIAVFVLFGMFVKEIALFGLVFIGICSGAFLWDHRPSITDDDIIIIPVENRATIDAISSLQAVRIVELGIQAIHNELQYERANAIKKQIKASQTTFALIDSILKTEKRRIGLEQWTEEDGERIKKIVQDYMAKEKKKEKKEGDIKVES